VLEHVMQSRDLEKLGAWKQRGLFAVACIVVAGAMPACRSVRGDEALVLIDVAAAPDVPPFGMVRFSVTGRPEIAPADVAFPAAGSLRFGYYLPGPNGRVEVRAAALAGISCVVGGGTTVADVQLGHVSPVVSLVVVRAAVIDPDCLDGGDASVDAKVDGGGDAKVDGGGDGHADVAADGASEARPDVSADGATDVSADGAADVHPDAPADGAADVRPDAPTDGSSDARVDMGTDVVTPPPPMCIDPARSCTSGSTCCGGRVCATTATSAPAAVCCGKFGTGCNTSDGTDCCGQLECSGSLCCLPVKRKCSPSANECCGGRACDTTLSTGSSVHICCGNAGMPCSDVANGTDCCRSLYCGSDKKCH
jgi:hypothetical protein